MTQAIYNQIKTDHEAVDKILEMYLTDDRGINDYLKQTYPEILEGRFRPNKRELLSTIFKDKSAKYLSVSIADVESKKPEGLIQVDSSGNKLIITPQVLAKILEGKSSIQEADIHKYKSMVRDMLDSYNLTLMATSKKRELQIVFYNLLSASYKDIGPITSSQVQKDAIKDVLKKFKVRGMKISYEKLKRVSPVSVHEITLNEFGKTEYSTRDNIKLDIDVLTETMNQYTTLASRLKPFVSKLKYIAGANKHEIKTSEVDLLVGSLSLKSFDRRDKIYEYWRQKHKSFDDFIYIQNRALKGLLKILADAEETIIVDLIKEIEANKLTEADNYIVSVPKQKVDKDNLNYTAAILLEDFLSIDSNDVEFVFADDEDIDKDPEEGAITARGKGVEETRTETERAEIMPTTEKVKSILDGINNIKTTKETDPLFYYAWSQGAFDRVPMFKKDISKIHRRIKSASKRLTVELDESELEELDKYIEGLSREAFSGEADANYYLPLTDKVMSEFKIPREKQIEKKLKTYFELVTQLYDLGGKSRSELATDISSGKVGEKSARRTKYQSFVARRKGEGLADIFDRGRQQSSDESVDALIEQLKELIDVLYSSMVRPLQSEYMPFDETEFAFITNKQLKVITENAESTGDALSTLTHRMNDMGTAILPKKALKQIANLLTQLGNIKVGENLQGIKISMEQLAKQLDRIYDFQHTDDIAEEFGASLYEIRAKNNLDVDLEFNGVNVNKLYKKYQSKREAQIYPLAALIKTIKKQESLFRTDKHLSGRKQDKGLGRGAATEEGETKDEDLIGRVIQAYDNLIRKKLLIKSDLEYKILEAHDSIRKMINKPIYYGLGNIDSFDDITKTIDVAKEDYNINLTALDVENINSEFGAYKDIGRKHGVSAEVVYFIKANFR